MSKHLTSLLNAYIKLWEINTLENATIADHCHQLAENSVAVLDELWKFQLPLNQ